MRAVFHSALAGLMLLTVAMLANAADGRQLIEEFVRRYALPAYVFEEQAWVLTDRVGKMSVRTTRHYSRRDATGSRRLWVVDTPTDARGASIQIARAADGSNRQGSVASSPAFGSTFLVADIEGEQLADFRYEYDGDQDIDRVPHHVVRAMPRDDSMARRTGYFERRLYLRKDNAFLSRIDYREPDGRPWRRQSFRDPRPDDTGIWRPGMILMEDMREGAKTLLKIERRVHSADYVPAEVFAAMKAQP